MAVQEHKPDAADYQAGRSWLQRMRWLKVGGAVSLVLAIVIAWFVWPDRSCSEMRTGLCRRGTVHCGRLTDLVREERITSERCRTFLNDYEYDRRDAVMELTHDFPELRDTAEDRQEHSR